MTWLSTLLSFFRPRNSSATYPASWFVEWIRGGMSADSGVAVNGNTALTWAPLWYGINKIAGHVAQLPCDLRERTASGVNRLLDSHPSYWLLNNQPNELMTPSVFRETLMHHAILWGNGRAAIYRNDRREPNELVPLLPDRTWTVRINGEKWHIHREPENGQETPFRDNDVLHICGFGFDGLQGLSLIEYARNSIGMGLAQEKYANRFYRNNATPNLVLEAPPGMFRREEEAREFLRNWQQWHEGPENANKVGLLREGMKATTLAGMSTKDAQWLEGRVFQRQEAALWLLLEQILGDGSSVSYNSLEQKNLGYLVNCLMRWLVKWEEELARKLLTRTQFESGRYYWKFKVAALLRGTTAERYSVYQIGIQNRILNPNEVREMEDLPPYEGGDEYGNPAITPGPTESPESDGSSTDDADETAVQAIAARLEVLAKVERQRVRQAADKHARKFLAWMDEFYEDFGTRIRYALNDVAAPAVLATEWIETSRQRLLDCAGRATADTLPTVVQMEIDLWPCRSMDMARRIQEARKCAA